MIHDSLGDRMKRNYEDVFRQTLPGRMPIILRVDGRAFHTVTKNLVRPFDDLLMSIMNNVAISLCEEISGAQLAYVQSDEVSILIHPYKRLQSQCWLNGNVQKMASIAASIATVAFNSAWQPSGAWPQFDARVFVVPESEVCNYFLWREQDATRNSVQMLARSLYSHNACEGMNGADLQEMCFQKGQNWNDLPADKRRGRCVVRERRTPEDRPKWEVDFHIPIFSQDRAYIERHLAVESEEST